ncbi:MAG: DUF5107 domain-containing protein [Chloroflexi bacterium]|nr:DUF5107 domain-containing protein [Chloroflexota bacterium]
MAATIDTHWHYHGVRAVVLENRLLRVVVLPETGGRIYSLVHKPSDTEFLWHNPRMHPRLTPFGTSFDDNLVGGWDDLLPTVDACMYKGEAIPDHGEVWGLAWDWQVMATADGQPCLFTAVSAPITPVCLERWLSLDAHQPELRVRYRLTNLAPQPVDLLFGLHPMFAISPAHRLDLPPARMLVELASAERFGQVGQVYEWPHLPTNSGAVDMRTIPASDSQAYAGHYATETTAGWFALTDTASQVGLAFVYPTNVFKALWLWMCYGGWRDHYHLAVEPWTGYPVNLAQAAAAGRQLILAAHQSLEFSVTAFAYTGRTEVSGVDQRGEHYTAR